MHFRDELKSKRFKLLIFCFVSIIAIFLCWIIFPQPDYKLWPPHEKNEKQVVYVTIGDYHSCLDFPDYTLKAFQEWHMGAKEWYLSEDADLFKIAVKAFSERVPGVIKFGVFSRPFWERENKSKENVFTFWLSQEGFRRLQISLHKHRGKMIARRESFWYYQNTAGYHLLDNCNGYIAQALCDAGLPVRKALAQEKISMTWQLKRCSAIQNAFFESHAGQHFPESKICKRGNL